MTIIRLENLLKAGAGGTLNKIIRRAQNMDELTTALRAALPALRIRQAYGCGQEIGPESKQLQGLRESGDIAEVS
jgi:hypothetical protein